MRAWFGRLKGPQRAGLVGGGVLVIALVGVVVAATLTRSTKNAGTKVTTTTTTTTTTTIPPGSKPICPLTGESPPGGKVPQRPALAVKIGNDPASRPQSGLDHADIVYEEMAEGGITRYMAVFQCQTASLIGPTRSVRWDDWHQLQAYGRPILAYSGGISYWTDAVAALPWIFNADGSAYPIANAFFRYQSSSPPASLGAPYNYYTSTGALWGLDKHNTTPPPQQFHFSKTAPSFATPVGSTSIPFSSASMVQWTWGTKSGQWLRTYSGFPDKSPGGTQFHAANVVIQIVSTRPGPYNESGPNSPDVESITIGSGRAYILRNGRIETGTWSRSSYSDITTFTAPGGATMTFSPGTTWFEVVPSNIKVTFIR